MSLRGMVSNSNYIYNQYPSLIINDLYILCLSINYEFKNTIVFIIKDYIMLLVYYKI